MVSRSARCGAAPLGANAPAALRPPAAAGYTARGSGARLSVAAAIATARKDAQPDQTIRGATPDAYAGHSAERSGAWKLMNSGSDVSCQASGMCSTVRPSTPTSAQRHESATRTSRLRRPPAAPRLLHAAKLIPRNTPTARRLTGSPNGFGVNTAMGKAGARCNRGPLNREGLRA